MNPQVFSQAVDETFPNLDSELRIEIKQKVLAHMIENLKDKVYMNDVEGSKQLNQMVDNEPDETKRSELYIKQITEKYLSLPSDEQKKIDEELDEELTRVMHKLFKESI